MKQLIFIFLVGLATSSFSQEYTKQFFKTDYDQYLGAEFIVDQSSISGWTNAFYLDFDASLSLSSDVSFQSEEYTFKTDPEKLPPGPYSVVEILDRNDNPKIRFSEARFKLLAADGTEFWFRYDSKYEHNFVWLVGKIEIDVEAVCSKITVETDDFTGDKTIRTPFGPDAQLTKIIKGGTATTYLSLDAKGSTLNVGEQGVIILFEDGSKLEYPSEAIDSDVGSGSSWDYSAFIRLDNETLNKLTIQPLDKWRLFIYDNDFDQTEAEMFQIQAKCISEMN